jgi:hypothetical protein
MKFDHDCARGLLLVLEDRLVMLPDGRIKGIGIEELAKDERLARYEYLDVLYTLQKLIEANYVRAYRVANFHSLSYAFMMDGDGITFEGHRYLDAIRADSVWDKVKSSLTKVGGSAPFALVLSIAEEYLKRSLFGSE